MLSGEISLERMLAHLRAAIVRPGGFIGESAREDITALELLLHQAEGSFVELFVVDYSRTTRKNKFICGYLERVIIPDALPVTNSAILSPEEQSEIMKSYRIFFMIRVANEPYKINVSINLFQTVVVSHDKIYESSGLNLSILRPATEREKKLFLRGRGHKEKSLLAAKSKRKKVYAVSA